MASKFHSRLPPKNDHSITISSCIVPRQLRSQIHANQRGTRKEGGRVRSEISITLVYVVPCVDGDRALASKQREIASRRSRSRVVNETHLEVRPFPTDTITRHYDYFARSPRSRVPVFRQSGVFESTRRHDTTRRDARRRETTRGDRAHRIAPPLGKGRNHASNVHRARNTTGL